MSKSTTAQIAAEINDLQAAARRADYAARAKKAAETRARKAAEAAEAAAREEAEKATEEATEATEAPAKTKTPYMGPMLALRSAAKHYVKGLHCGDEIATAFSGLKSEATIEACITALGLGFNPYTHLNIGQQSMNLRNRIRAAYKKGTLNIEILWHCIDRAQIRHGDKAAA